MPRHEYIHPALREIVNAIAPAPNTRICDAGSGAPAGATASERDDSPQMAHDGPARVASPSPTAGPAAIHRRATSSNGLRNPAVHHYQLLVELTALHAPAEGYSDAAQLPPLTNRARAVILRGAPDVLNDFALEPDEIADIFEQEVDARLWLAAKIEPLLRRELFLAVAAELEADAQVLRQNAADPELRRSDLL